MKVKNKVKIEIAVIMILLISLIIFFKIFVMNNDSQKIINEIKLGDYIKMTPTSTNYKIDSDITGYTLIQEINPSKLNIWRVIKINDETIEVISEYVTSEKIYFSGKVGYINLVNCLNEIAKSYTNEEYVLETRNIGYSNQTEILTNYNILDNPKWLTSTNDNINEKDGGGDTLYERDYNLIKEILGSTKALSYDNKESSYWLSSRYYKYEEGNYSFNGRVIDKEGEIKERELITYDKEIGVNNQLSGNSIRPILILKRNIEIIKGDGKSKETAYELK